MASILIPALAIGDHEFRARPRPMFQLVELPGRHEDSFYNETDGPCRTVPYTVLELEQNGQG